MIKIKIKRKSDMILSKLLKLIFLNIYETLTKRKTQCET